MPEISLRDYLAKLNNLLNANAADEVIHHCRHILQYFPKNVAAYRFLGRGLIQNGRWDEAGAALRRVLSVIPDDFAAHVGMSEALERQNRHDEAIWHLERAYEQRPGEKELLDALRELYRRYRGVESAKLPLTAAAVARQSLRSGAYDNAIEKLRDALSRAEDRVDLRLLLAQALWLKDSRLEAAELAMDVLEVLPDCMEANRILSELWLVEGRPSDAQRYINRIESVDPYLAVELVQNQPADDNAFRLEELDYRRSAQSELAQERPDWLQGITPASAPANEDDAPAEDEWSEWVSAMLQGSQTETPAPAPAEEEDWMAPVKRPSTGSLNKYQPPTPDELDEIEALFNAEIDLNAPVTIDADEDGDPMAWLRDAGVDFVDEAEASAASRPTFADEDDDFRLPEVEDNPVAWLDRYHEEQRVEETPQPPAQVEDDLPDWMRDIDLPPLDSDDEFEIETPAEPAMTDDDQPLAWLEEEFLPDATRDADSPAEMPPLESLTFGRPDSPRDESSMWEQELSETTDQPAPSVETPADEPPQGVPGPKRGLTSLLNDAEFAWTEESAASDAPDDDWMSLFDDRRKTSELTTTSPDWLAELDTSAAGTESPAWTDEFESKTEVDTGGEFGWKTSSEDELTDEDLEEAAMAPEMPDWLSSLEPDKRDQGDSESESLPVEPGGDEDFEWMTSLGEDDEAAAVSSDMPDWLSELDPNKREEDDGDLEPLPPIEDDEEFEWMNVQSPETAVGDDQLPVTPDWLTEFEPSAEGETPSPSAPPMTGTDEEFAWMTAVEDAEVDEVEAAAESAETPDWLTQIQASRQDEMAQQPQGIPTEAQDDLEWVDALDEDEVERAAEPAEMPDWLSEMQATQSTTEPDALSEVEQPQASAPINDEEFDWMTSFENDDEDALAAPILDGETIDGIEDIGDMDEVGEVDEVELAAAETPDWLAELEPKSEQAEAQPEASSLTGDEFDWLDEDAAEPSAAEPAASSMPDWLQEIKPVEAEELLEPEPAAQSSEGYEWLDSALSETKVDFEDEPVPAADVPDWLAALDETNIEADEAGEAGEFDAITGANAFQTEGQASDDAVFEETLTPTPAENAPDWLNAMVPGFDVDYAPSEEETLEPVEERAAEPASREFGWLVNIVEEESRTAPRTSFVFSRPPAWMEQLAPTTYPEAAPPDDDFPDWPSEEDGELPEWLR